MIVTVTNIKGGVGKTTTAIALASAVAEAGGRAVVYDADPQGSASEWAMLAGEGGEPLPFEVRPANIAAIRRLADEPGTVAIIDCPPSGAVTDEAVDAAGFVVVPTSPAPADLSKTWETVDAVSARGKVYAVLVAKAQANTLTLKSAMSELEDNGISYFETVIPKREALASAFGRPMDDLHGYGAVLDEMRG